MSGGGDCTDAESGRGATDVGGAECMAVLGAFLHMHPPSSNVPVSAVPCVCAGMDQHVDGSRGGGRPPGSAPGKGMWPLALCDHR